MTTDVITTSPRKLDSGTTGARNYVQIQVLGAGKLFYGASQSEITSSSTNPTQQQGLQISAADGIKQFWWTGPLWAVCDAPTEIAWSIEPF